MGSIPGLAVSRGVGCRCGLDPELLWLWHRPAATALIRPLAWEPSYAEGAAQAMAKKPEKDKKKKCKDGERNEMTCLEHSNLDLKNLNAKKFLVHSMNSRNIGKFYSWQCMVAR